MKKTTIVKKTSTITEELGRRIANGEERSTGDWAALLCGNVEEDKGRARITYALSALRKKGFMYFATESYGPIKDVTRSEVDFNFIYNRYVDKKVEPQLMRSFEYAERLIQEFPKLREAVLDRAKAVLKMANDSNKQLLGIPYGKK